MIRARKIQKFTILSAVSLIFIVLECRLNIDVVEEDVPLSNDVKYMLLWTGNEDHPLDTFGDGQEVFIRNKCSFQNCYVTTNRNLLGDVRKFHALAFSGLNNLLKCRLTNLSNLPKSRSPRQKYIFFQSESSPRYPVCNKTFDEFFNWTATYRLRSDIPYPYILTKEKNGEIMAPKRKVNWEKHLDDNEFGFQFHLNKSKAAAWFVTSCISLGGREGYVARLQEALKPRGLEVDVYSSSNCGDLKCPRENETQCAEKLRHEYFFYLAFENSFDEDYVTEKILTALHNNVVPIVFGAADYSRDFRIVIFLLTAISTIVGQPGKCDQTPIGAKVLTATDTKNAPFRLTIDSDGQKFLEDQTYVLILDATNDSRPFKEFMITVEDPEVDDSPYGFEHSKDVGTLKTLDEDTKSRYSERCSSSVENTDQSDKDRIETHWVSPKVSVNNQRIRFRAMVAENKEKWYSGEELTIILEKDDASSLDSPPVPPNDTCSLCSEARYEVIFKGKWSRLTHPNKYPSKPDDNGYTHMVGASHSYNFILWKTGEKARAGLRALVENADTAPMEKYIIRSMSETDGTRTLIRGTRRHHPHMSEPSHSLFRVDRFHHLFSLVVGMRPSPDWFLGTKQFELCTYKGWLEHAEIPLYPFDAGTMDGISYDSPRSMTQPEENVDRVAVGSFNKESPFYQMNLHDMAPFAFLEVNRLDVYPLQDVECVNDGAGTLEAVDLPNDEESKESAADGEYRDGQEEEPQAAESRSHSQTMCVEKYEWSSCVPEYGSCGRGVQTWRRRYYQNADVDFDSDAGSSNARQIDECQQRGTSILETKDCFVSC